METEYLPSAKCDFGSVASRPTSNDSAAQKARACATCARLKIKCRWPATGTARSDSSCTRCARMKIPCHVPDSTQRKKRGKSTRVAALEEKIDGIVSLLASGKHLNSQGSSPLTPESVDTTQARQQSTPATTTTTHSQLSEQFAQIQPATRSASSTYHLIPGFSLTKTEAESLLNAYREEYMPKFPFVIIHPFVDAQTLHDESPALFWMIMAAVAPQSVQMHAAIKKWFRQYLAEHVVVQQEMSLSILQAILVQLSWGDFHFYLNMEATNLLQLAIALAIDLKLDRVPEAMATNQRSLLGDAWSLVHNNNLIRPKVVHTADDRRAILGLYHLTSFVTCFSRRGIQFRWNTHLGQCCDWLLDAQELESDLLIVALVQMQRVVDRVYTLMPGSDIGEPGPKHYEAPLDMGINGIWKSLQSVAAKQPDTVKNDRVFSIFLKMYMMRLYEPAISMQAVPFSSDVDPLLRSAALWKCVESCNDIFSNLSTVSHTEFPSLPLTVTGALAYAVVTFSRLMLLDSPSDWDPARAQRQFDFSNVLSRIANIAESADKWSQKEGRRRRAVEDNGVPICKYSFKLRWIRKWYMSRILNDPSVGPMQGVHGCTSSDEAAVDQPAAQQQHLEIDNLPDMPFDPSFWGDFFAPLGLEHNSMAAPSTFPM